MRRLKLQMQMTINGYVAQPNGKNNWMTWNPDEELVEYMNSLLDTSDTLLLGRKTAESIIKYREDTSVENPAHPFAKKIAALPKIVFSKNDLCLIFGDALVYITPSPAQFNGSFATFNTGIHRKHLIIAEVFSNVL